MIEPLEIGLRRQHFGRLDKIEIEITGRARNAPVAAAEQKARHAKPLHKMLALEPGFEFCLAPGAAIVEDRKYSGLGHHLPATTMISTL
ncbi:MAG: hypothetical protein WA177_15790 [Xanthobacteraceae bacterium]